MTVDQVLATPAIYGVLTRAQCCPPTCGAAAAVLVSEDFAKRHGLPADVAILRSGHDHGFSLELRPALAHQVRGL
jgi:hypothetical protein